MAIEPTWPDAIRLSAEFTDDAVVVIPGIMGSALYDKVAAQWLWGLRPSVLTRAWSRSGGMDGLAVTEEELAGKSTRVQATGLLTLPAFSPVLAGFEPYTRLVRAVRKVVADRSAVLEFPYDWRLSVHHNAGLLAKAVDEHLSAWRQRLRRPDARVVLVAHSMGGLLCQEMAAIPGALDLVRAVITLGTPFDGAAKAAVILAEGDGAPRPTRRLRRVARTMPGLYDLLPSYQCLDEGDHVRVLTPSDVVGLGGVRQLAEAAADDRVKRIRADLPRHRALVGIEQPTLSSLTMENGTATGHRYTFTLEGGDLARYPNGILKRPAGLGDGTVPRNSARPPSVPAFPIAQQHTTLAHSDQACDFVCDVLKHGEADTGERLTGDVAVGLDLPDVVRPGEVWTAMITGIAAHHATCTVEGVETRVPVSTPQPRQEDGEVLVRVALPSPGLYRVRIGGGSAPVTQMVLAEEPPND